ncbi:hypothetical protein L6452_31421 [Arctium lappa]|uniref:Uncharacterized protein n=1 Tax=Arctium lappa TaxID=4217 RepID=A0ACB8Z2N5_ARCLA|nr:hypothetical protein L6452_31421 [Arctium lappa]
MRTTGEVGRFMEGCRIPDGGRQDFSRIILSLCLCVYADNQKTVNRPPVSPNPFQKFHRISTSGRPISSSSLSLSFSSHFRRFPQLCSALRSSDIATSHTLEYA